MDLLLFVFLLESVLASLGEVQPDGVLADTILPLRNCTHTSYTLTASCSRYCTGRFVQFTGTGYFPLADLGKYNLREGNEGRCPH